jgi:hypothetical protein
LARHGFEAVHWSTMGAAVRRPENRGSLTPQMHVAFVRPKRALSLPSLNALPVSDAVSTSFASTASASVRFFRITAFIYVNAHSH